jgi:drug/metabolite transporter (DMT)-like permease
MKDTVPAAVLGVIGVVLLAGGWAGASGRAALSGQMGFVTLAVAGLVVAGAGAVVHISSLTQRLEARSDRFDEVVTAWLNGRAS